MLEKLYKLSTTEISDALDSCGTEGGLLGLRPIINATRLAGPVFTVKYAQLDLEPKEFQMPVDYIDQVPAGSVILIDNQGKSDVTSWGELLTHVAIKNKISGTIVNGAIRDIKAIKSLNYPIYSKHIYMRSGKNRVKITDTQCELKISNILIKPGDYIVADDNGVIVIPQQKLAEIINKAENIKHTESQILQDIKAGVSLQQARKNHRYDKPWLSRVET